MISRYRLLLLFSIVLGMAGTNGDLTGQTVVLDLRCVPEGWQLAAAGRFSAHFDRREICRINHPWETTAAGDYGEIWRMVTIPEDWQPPFWLRWYCSDNYVGEGIERSVIGEGRSGVVMVGHRFKQLLVDDNVVWDRDVADPIFPGTRSAPLEPAGGEDPFPPYFCLDVSPYVTPGKPFRLALRVLDKVASTERLEKDWRAEFRWYDKPEEFKNTTFSTDVYWADVTLHRGEKPPATAVEPSWQLPLKEVPLPRASGEVHLQSVPMVLERADLLGEAPFPVSCGVPFPEGAVKMLNLALTDPDGNELPIQGRPFLYWPDGSVKWARIDFLARRPVNVGGEWLLTFGTEVEPAPLETPVRVEQKGEDIVVHTGAVELVVSRVGENIVDAVRLAGQAEPLSSGINNSLFVGLPAPQADGSIVDRWVGLKARKEAVEVEAEGPLRACLNITGHISDGGNTVLGRFVTRLEAYAGQPYVKLTHRIFNDYPAPSVRIRAFDFQIPLDVRKPEAEHQREAAVPGMYGTGRPPAGIFVRFGKEGEKELSEVEEVQLIQVEADRYNLYGVPALQQVQERAEGWAAYWGYRGGVGAFVRHFWQQYPQGLAEGRQSLWLRLFAYCAQQQYYQPTQGEAKRLEFWLTFFPDTPLAEKMEDFNNLVQQPPHLFSAKWVRASGGLGPAPQNPEERFPAVYKGNTSYGPWNPDQLARDGSAGYGLRNWGDSFNPNHWVKAGYGSAWSNNYYDPLFKHLLAYILSGEPTRFEQAKVMGTHYMDVDVCHYRAGHPEYVGGDYMLCFDHTGTLAPTGVRPEAQGLIVLGLLTADPDFLETAMLMADRIVAVVKEADGKLGFRGCAPRCLGFPLQALMDAYDISPKPEYLEAAKKLLERAGDSTDPRRGAQFGCGGPTYFSIGHSEGQTAWGAMAYYRVTKDPQAARRVIALAEAMLNEPGGPVTWRPWGHLESEAALYAYAYALTGDETYLEHAQRCLIGEPNTSWMGNWMPQKHLEAMYWIERALPVE